MRSERHLGLLEQIAEYAGYGCLSDLRMEFAPAANAVVAAVEAIEPKCFPAEEWSEAYLYITGETCRLKDRKEIKRDLIQKVGDLIKP